MILIKSVIECRDASSLYEIPLQLSAQDMDDIVIKRLDLDAKYETQLDEWQYLLILLIHLMVQSRLD